MTLMEALILVNTLALLAGVLVLSRLAGRIGRATEEVGLAARRVAELTPVARTQLEALRSLTNATTGVVEDVRMVSGQASAVTTQLLRGVESEIFDRYRAVFAGIRAGAGVLRRFRSGNGYRESQSADMEDFDQVRE